VSSRCVGVTLSWGAHSLMSALGQKQTLRPQIGMAMTAKQRKTTAYREAGHADRVLAAFSASSRLFDWNGETKTVRAKHSSTIIVR